MISDFFKSVIDEKQMKIKQITKILTICEIFEIHMILVNRCSKNLTN
jgi:hypothetical protein